MPGLSRGRKCASLAACGHVASCDVSGWDDSIFLRVRYNKMFVAQGALAWHAAYTWHAVTSAKGVYLSSVRWEKMVLGVEVRKLWPLRTGDRL